MDLKPANMMLDKRGTVKVGDFGQTLMKERGKKTVLENLGSPTYMAPEMVKIHQTTF